MKKNKVGDPRIAGSIFAMVKSACQGAIYSVHVSTISKKRRIALFCYVKFIPSSIVLSSPNRNFCFLLSPQTKNSWVNFNILSALDSMDFCHRLQKNSDFTFSFKFKTHFCQILLLTKLIECFSDYNHLIALDCVISRKFEESAW